MSDSLNKLQNILLDENFDGKVLEMEPMSIHTSYKIGGPASFFVYVDSIQYLKKLVTTCNALKLNWMIIGKGTNLLVSDDGYQGIVIMLGRDFKKIEFRGDVCVAGASASLARVVNESFRKAYGGFEFAVGTPGLIGGAIKMNAGTATDWIGSRVIDITLMNNNGELIQKKSNEIEWDYRRSSIDDIVLSAKFKVSPLLKEKDIYELQAKMEGILSRRRNNQPLSQPSCGSMFKNPPNNSAGKLIEEAGLKGCRCGGALVSTKHANFIVNTGRATALDVVTLMRHIQKEIFDLYSIKLEPEVKFVGFSEACSLWD